MFVGPLDTVVQSKTDIGGRQKVYKWATYTVTVIKIKKI